MLTTRFHDSLDAFDGADWDALVGSDNPFVSHAFLAGLERHGCIRPDWGWQPYHLGLYERGRLVAAAPVYLKGNSHGEYVFDWSWAHAWERAGGVYYPKLLCAVPYSPVPGTRLLAAGHAEYRAALVQALWAETRRLQLSSAHVNFLPEDETGVFDDDWLTRFDFQYHWHNRGYGSFDDFLAALTHKKRKNIRHERRRVEQKGLDCRMIGGSKLNDADWESIHALYVHTFDEKGNHPALTAEFFRHLGSSMGDRVQVALARRGDSEPVAMAFFLRGGDTLYGRYWGAHEDVPALHFELCYYQGIDYAIREGIAHFEPGAQGRHKMARGFLPVRTHSRHYLAHEGFREAVAEALASEAEAMEAYGEELKAHSPYAERP